MVLTCFSFHLILDLLLFNNIIHLHSTIMVCFMYNATHTDVRDMDNNTPLHFACEGGNKDLVVYLIEVIKCDVGE